MIRRPSGPHRTTTLFPSAPLFRSADGQGRGRAVGPEAARREARIGKPVAEGEKRLGPGPRVPAIADVRPLVHPHRDMGMLGRRSEEHTSELQSLMRTSYAVFCLKNKNLVQATPASIKRTNPK